MYFEKHSKKKKRIFKIARIFANKSINTDMIKFNFVVLRAFFTGEFLRTMKYFFIFSLLICSFYGCRPCNDSIGDEKTFKINGKVDDASTENFIFKYYRCEKDSSVIDTVSVVNGIFTIEGIISPRTLARLSMNDQEVVFYLDPGKMQLYLIKDSLENSVLKGSKTQADRESLELQTKPLADYSNKIRKQISSEQDLQNNDFLINQKDSIDTLLENIWIDFITSHPTSYYSLDAIVNLLISNKQNANFLMSLFDGLSENIKSNCSGKQVHGYIIQRKNSTLTNVSSLEALDKDGTLIKLSDYVGKYVLIDFWASWCVPCIIGFPHLKELHTKYKDNGLVVIGISMDKKEDEQKWLDAIEKNDISEWIHILSCKNKGENNICDLHDMLQDPSIPHYIVIDKSGNILKHWRGFNDAVAKEQNEMFENIFDGK